MTDNMRTKILTLVFTLFFTLIGFCQEIKPKLEKQGDRIKATYYFDNGKVKEVGFFLNNKLHGEWITFNEEGEKTAVANYENGKKTGKWYVLANGTVNELIYDSNKLVNVRNLDSTETSPI
jgi:antitoxin component YwqK of YwqJK toxin-antitoxin module